MREETYLEMYEIREAILEEYLDLYREYLANNESLTDIKERMDNLSHEFDDITREMFEVDDIIEE